MDGVDVWLISLGSGEPEAVVQAFAVEFELSVERAREMTARLPRVVLRAASDEDAGRLAERLRSTGLLVEIRPSAPALELSPGARPSRPSQPVPAAPPVSLYPRASKDERRSLRPSSRPTGGGPHPFLRTRDLPPFEGYAASLVASRPAAESASARSVLGPGLSLVESIGGRSVRLDLVHVQGRRSPVARTRFVVALPTRGADVEVSPHRNMPQRFEWRKLSDPGLAGSGLLVAPSTLRTELFDPSIEAELAALIGSDGDPPELRIVDDSLTLEISGWPSTPVTVQRGFVVVAELAGRAESAIARVAAAHGDLGNHPDVRALRELRESRVRIGRMILGAVVLAVVAAMVFVAWFATRSAP